MSAETVARFVTDGIIGLLTIGVGMLLATINPEIQDTINRWLDRWARRIRRFAEWITQGRGA